MIETMIVIGIVLIAAGGVGYGLYRSATGKSGCAGCKGCGTSSDLPICSAGDGAKIDDAKTESKEQ
jgi:hypothetical protein